jgi:hypothetical protein
VSSIVLALAQGDLEIDSSRIPSNAFEITSSGVGIGFSLKEIVEKGGKKLFFLLYLKNETQSDLYYHKHPAISQIEIYYINSSGLKVPLRDYQYANSIEINSSPLIIGPGHTLLIRIPLKDDDLKVLLTHQVFCSCYVFEGGTKMIKVVSSPKNLTLSP